MQWILLGVVGVALAALATRYPKIAFGLLGALLLGAALIVSLTAEQGAWRRQQLPVQDIQIQTPMMRPGYGDSYQFSARLLNTHGRLALREAVLRISMLDCPAGADQHADRECTLLGQAEPRVHVKIPPQQARDVSANVVFGAAKPSGALRWKYQLLETRS